MGTPRSFFLVWVPQGQLWEGALALALSLCVLVPVAHKRRSWKCMWSEREMKYFPKNKNELGNRYRNSKMG